MSSFNTVTKIKYTERTSEPVTLNEYIVFQDDKAKCKYIVFRFNNNVTQQLLGMQFEVCQYNAENNLIEKSVVAYNQFLAGAEEEFVPKAKLRVSFACSSISVRLIQAAFDRFVWKEGEYTDSTYKFDMFYHDEVNPQGDGADKKADKGKKSKDKKAKREKPEKYKKSKHPFILRDATARNIAKFPKVFNVIAIILVIAFVGVTMYIFKKDTKKFTEDSYLVRIYDDGVAVYGYTGSDSNLVIPKELGGYTVKKIDSGAFKDSKISTVTINCDIIIADGAFVNCKNLQAVFADTKYEIKGNDDAFRNCPKLIIKPSWD